MPVFWGMPVHGNGQYDADAWRGAESGSPRNGYHSGVGQCKDQKGKRGRGVCGRAGEGGKETVGADYKRGSDECDHV